MDNSYYKEQLEEGFISSWWNRRKIKKAENEYKNLRKDHDNPDYYKLRDKSLALKNLHTKEYNDHAEKIHKYLDKLDNMNNKHGLYHIIKKATIKSKLNYHMDKADESAEKIERYHRNVDYYHNKGKDNETSKMNARAISNSLRDRDNNEGSNDNSHTNGYRREYPKNIHFDY